MKVYHSHVAGPETAADHVTKGRMFTLARAAVWNPSLPLMVAAMLRGANLALNGATLAGNEEAIARNVRSQVNQVAPDDS